MRPLLVGAAAIAVAVMLAGCNVTSFGDCAISCTPSSGCPNGLTCEAEGYCRVEGFSSTCDEVRDAALEPDAEADADPDDPDARIDAANCQATESSCDDTLDNDCDGDTDCQDSECTDEVACNQNCGIASRTETPPAAIPDNVGSMQSAMTITGFPDGATLTDFHDVLRVCVTIEHSWARDLEILAIAPDSTQVMLNMQLGNTGGELLMGVPVDEPCDSNPGCVPVPGVGHQYCWSPDAGRIEMYPYMDTMPAVDSIPPSTNHPADDYAASSGFSPWVGTPLNGTWRFRARDLWAVDNGVVFGWSIAFDQSLVEDCAGFPQD
jgi:hypothetical protein